MKSIFIAFDQAYYERIVDMLEKTNCRGFTAWQEVQGRGTKSGEPHYGSHAWPSMASAIITIVEDNRVDAVPPFQIPPYVHYITYVPHCQQGYCMIKLA